MTTLAIATLALGWLCLALAVGIAFGRSTRRDDFDADHSHRERVGMDREAA